jgi:hypothetical protein
MSWSTGENANWNRYFCSYAHDSDFDCHDSLLTMRRPFSSSVSSSNLIRSASRKRQGPWMPSLQSPSGSVSKDHKAETKSVWRTTWQWMSKEGCGSGWKMWKRMRVLELTIMWYPQFWPCECITQLLNSQETIADSHMLISIYGLLADFGAAAIGHRNQELISSPPKLWSDNMHMENCDDVVMTDKHRGNKSNTEVWLGPEGG